MMIAGEAKTNGRKPKQKDAPPVAPSNEDLKRCLLKHGGGMEELCQGYIQCLKAPGLTDMQRLDAYEELMKLLFRGGDKDGLTEDNVQLVSDDDLIKVLQRNTPNG